MAPSCETSNSTRRTPYQYEPLSTPAAGLKQIRVVTLNRGDANDEINISIGAINIHDATSPDSLSSESSYEALSYTWGSDLQPKNHVTVDTGSSIEVYENLYNILQNLRLPDQDRKLWIDAICINQDESSDQAKLEKSWQIPMMHEIYNAAARVIIWLGPEQDDSTFALAFLNAIGESLIFDHTTYEMTPRMANDQATFLWNNWNKGFTHDRREHKAVLAILERPWFTRVWIRQEAFAASSRSVVMCGPASISLDALRNAVQVIAVKGLDARHPSHEKNESRLTLAASVFQKAYMTVLESLGRNRIAQCRVPQDKIYGCLGMIKLASHAGFVDTIATDYPVSVGLFKQFCFHYHRFFHNIQFLYHAGLCQRSLMGGPSWMPDWTVDFTRLDLSLERAVSHAMLADANFKDSGALSVKGVFATEVSRVQCLERTGLPTADSLPRAVHALASFVNAHIEEGNERQLTSFARAFGSALLWLRVPIEKIELHRLDFENFIRAIIINGQLPEYVEVRDRNSIPVFQKVIYFFQKTQLPFIVTDSGHIGVGADTTHPGDIVTAVLGLRHLLLLRRSTSASQYELVGSCSVHGFNWGEAILGPLHNDTVLVTRLDKNRSAYESYYHDTKTGSTSYWDPRIDWTKLTPGENEPAYTINAPKGEPRRKVPNAEFLKMYHRAKIVDIDLV